MLTKYKLINIPEGGVIHTLPGRRRVRITPNMSDSQADELISLGVTQYFLPITDQDNGKEKRSSSTGDSFANTSGTDSDQSRGQSDTGTDSAKAGSDAGGAADRTTDQSGAGSDSDQPGTDSADSGSDTGGAADHTTDQSGAGSDSGQPSADSDDGFKRIIIRNDISTPSATGRRTRKKADV
jgi:hypothetical protein